MQPLKAPRSHASYKEEIDRLKAELEYKSVELAKAYRDVSHHQAISQKYDDRYCSELVKNKDLERQLAEARAENERLSSPDYYACAMCPDIKQARQEVAREILQIISMETIDRPFEQSQAVEIIRQRFGLEG